MKWSFASVGLIMLGLFGIVIIMLFNDITVSNEQDYYTLKYATEASMLESVDVAYYRLTGGIKISQEKFVENFTRRFTETSTFGQGNYDIVFYQINETPPKVSLRIVDKTSGYNIYTYTNDVKTTQANIINELSAILEGEIIDKGKDGFEINANKGTIDRTKKESDCDIRIPVGIESKTGEVIYRCDKYGKEPSLKTISGKAVNEEDVVFDKSATQGAFCDGTFTIAGNIAGDNTKYVFLCVKKNNKKVYIDEMGNEVTNIELYSPNVTECIKKTVVGTVNGTSVKAYRCDLDEEKFEYQDEFGHLIEKKDIK